MTEPTTEELEDGLADLVAHTVVAERLGVKDSALWVPLSISAMPEKQARLMLHHAVKLIAAFTLDRLQRDA